GRMPMELNRPKSYGARAVLIYLRNSRTGKRGSRQVWTLKVSSSAKLLQRLPVASACSIGSLTRSKKTSKLPLKLSSRGRNNEGQRIAEMPDKHPSTGFAPADPTDGRDFYEWESRYPADAKKQIRL